MRTTVKAAAAMAFLAGPVAAQAPTSGPGVLPLHRLDLLPRLMPGVKTRMISSYDRSGGNDDGFSGKYSFVRKEGDSLILAELKGPGCITRIWTPTPTEDPIEFRFDDEDEPRVRLPFRDLFSGTAPPFQKPLVGHGAGGFTCYVPMPYRKSCKVSIRAKSLQFYQINYAEYPEGTSVETFSAESGRSDREEAATVLAATGSDLSHWSAGEGERLGTSRKEALLAHGKPLVLFDRRRGGRIVGLRLTPASAFAGPKRSALLKLTFDGATAYSGPAGDFFGFSWGEPAARSLLFGTDKDVCYSYFPMPFIRSARIEIVQEDSEAAPVRVTAVVSHTDKPREAGEGAFQAHWRRENPTTLGKPFTWLELAGKGHVVGLSVQAQGLVSGVTPFFEGDDQVELDGELTHHGTGSEDAFNGGWYDIAGRWDSRRSFPLHGCLDYQKPLARTGAYRLLLTDAYRFERSAKVAIEHAPEQNNLATDYAGVVYFYADETQPAPQPPPLSNRAVRNLERLIYHVGWNAPIAYFSYDRGLVSKRAERIGNQSPRFLRLETGGERDIFGEHGIGIVCEVPEAGVYRVELDTVHGPGQGVVQLFEDERPVGPKLDMHASERKVVPHSTVGALTLAKGANTIFLKLVGRNERSSGTNLDLVFLTLIRERR